MTHYDENHTKRIDWWNARGEEEASDRAHEAMNNIVHQWGTIHRRWLSNLNLYTNNNSRTLSGDVTFDDERSRKNPLNSAVNSFVSTVLNNKYRMSFAPEGADPRTRLKVEKMEKFIDGLISQQKLRYKPFRGAIKDACIFGAAVFKTWWEEGFDNRIDIHVGRVVPWSVFYDRETTAEGEPPREMYHIRLIDRQYLLDTYPEKAAIIKKAGTTSSLNLVHGIPGNNGGVQQVADRIRVIECWRVRAGKSEGSFATFIEGGALIPPQEWSGKTFPFTILEFEPNPVGWSLEAHSLVDSVAGQQAALELLTEWTDAAFRTMPRVLMIPRNADVSPEKVAEITEAGLHVMECAPGAAMWMSQPDPVNPQVIARERSEIDDIFKLSGVAQDMATANTPAGMESSKARMTDSNVKSSRFAAFYNDVSLFWVEISMSLIEAARGAKIMHPKGRIESFLENEKYVEKLDFDEIDLEDMQFVIRPQAMAQLPFEVSGQANMAEQLINMGVFSPAEAMDLMTGLPDLKSTTERLITPKKAVQLDVHAILEGERRYPDEMDDLQYAVAYASDAYLRIRRSDSEDLPEVLDALMEYIDVAKSLQEPPPQEQDPMAAMGGAPPPAPDPMAAMGGAPPPQQPMAPPPMEEPMAPPMPPEMM